MAYFINGGKESLKIHLDFVTNSSEVCYVISNRTRERKTILDFVKEVFAMYDKYGTPADDEWGTFTREEYLESAEESPIVIRGDRTFYYNWETDDPIECLLLDIFMSGHDRHPLPSFSLWQKDLY